jgi:hypothetical protein
LKVGAAPNFWTDAYYFQGQKFIWAATGENVDFTPEQVFAKIFFLLLSKIEPTFEFELMN